MADQTFDEAVNTFMQKLRSLKHDQEYLDAVDTIVYLWDQERANQINKAILPTPMLEAAEDGELYILLRIQPLRYLQVKRNKQAKVINYV